MVPAPDGVELGQIGIKEQMVVLGREVATYMNGAVDLVKESSEKLGFPGQSKVVCDTLLVDEGQFVHPVVTIIPDESKPGVSYAIGGKDFKDVYPVSGTPEVTRVDWGKNAKDYATAANSVDDELIIDDGELRVRTSNGKMMRNVLVKSDVYTKLVEQDRPRVIDRQKLSTLDTLVKGLRAASGNTNSQKK